MKVFVFDLLAYDRHLDHLKTGASTLLVSLSRGAMPHGMFLNQIRRFGREVMPRLRAHEVRRVPVAETAQAA